MYEKPKLNQVGDATDVVLGAIPTGDDMDGTWTSNDFDFAPEFDIRAE
jgi:hypothetical protein